MSTEPPPISTIQPMTPPQLDRVVKACLAKDPEDRWQTAHDVMLELKWIAEAGSQTGAVAAFAVRPRRRERLSWGLTVVFLALVSALAIWHVMHSPLGPRDPVRFSVTLDAKSPLAVGGISPVAMALSPDGRRLAYVVNEGGRTKIHLRALDVFEARPIPGTEGGHGPFFSPDGLWLGFFADGKLKKVSLMGGSPQVICEATIARGAAWGADDTILFTPSLETGLWRVAASGGPPQMVTAPNGRRGERSHRFPEILPGGKAVLFTNRIADSFDNAQIAVRSLRTGEQRIIVEGGSYARYATTGHVVFARAGSLLAVPFDLSKLEVTGKPVPVLDDVQTSLETGQAQFDLSSGGSLVYVQGGVEVTRRPLVWVTRQGAVSPLPQIAPREFQHPSLSADGRLAIGIVASNHSVWLGEVARGTLSPLTFVGDNHVPIWTPDGKRITFASTRGGPSQIFWVPADGSGKEEQLLKSEHAQVPTSWSPDGRTLAFTDFSPTATTGDIWVLSLDGDRRPRPFVQTPFDERGAMFSPDGRWLAYTSNESGRYEVYVQPFPGPGRKWQISTDGGSEPVWAPGARELFYRNGRKIVAVAIATEPSFRAATPQSLFEEQLEQGYVYDSRNYDIAPDGRRFLIVRSGQQLAATQINVVLDWFSEVRRRIPPGR